MNIRNITYFSIILLLVMVILSRAGRLPVFEFVPNLSDHALGVNIQWGWLGSSRSVNGLRLAVLLP